MDPDQGPNERLNYRVTEPKLLILDPDPTCQIITDPDPNCQVIADPDPDPTFQVVSDPDPIGILFVKFLQDFRF